MCSNKAPPRLVIDLVEVLERALGISLHGGRTGRPVSRAHFAVLIGKLESLHETQGLVHGATYGQVVHGDLAQNALGGDDEQATESDTGIVSIRNHHAVVMSGLLGDVSEERDVHLAEATLVTRSLHPGEVRKKQSRWMRKQPPC
eukprot:Mycagemm_TRINITY_DN2177_c0_g1::TRINITY_DN2177_c0_g1_i1::g.4552::m.4552 type:complete len:145 gc:universal TRINITY_DN2177_c0_g1_i1:595-161(-)